MLQVGTKFKQQFEAFTNTKVVTIFLKGGRQFCTKTENFKITLKSKFKGRSNEEIEHWVKMYC